MVNFILLSSHFRDFHGVPWLGTFHDEFLQPNEYMWQGLFDQTVLDPFRASLVPLRLEASVLKLLRQKADLERVQGLQVQLEAS